MTLSCSIYFCWKHDDKVATYQENILAILHLSFPQKYGNVFLANTSLFISLRLQKRSLKVWGFTSFCLQAERSFVCLHLFLFCFYFFLFLEFVYFFLKLVHYFENLLFLFGFFSSWKYFLLLFWNFFLWNLFRFIFVFDFVFPFLFSLIFVFCSLYIQMRYVRPICNYVYNILGLFDDWANLPFTASETKWYY